MHPSEFWTGWAWATVFVIVYLELRLVVPWLWRQWRTRRLPRWRHRRTRGLYVELARGLRESDKAPQVVYQSLADGRVWIRPEPEFMDGRFEPAPRKERR